MIGCFIVHGQKLMLGYGWRMVAKRHQRRCPEVQLEERARRDPRHFSHSLWICSNNMEVSTQNGRKDKDIVDIVEPKWKWSEVCFNKQMGFFILISQLINHKSCFFMISNHKTFLFFLIKSMDLFHGLLPGPCCSASSAGSVLRVGWTWKRALRSYRNRCFGDNPRVVLFKFVQSISMSWSCWEKALLF